MAFSAGLHVAGRLYVTQSAGAPQPLFLLTGTLLGFILSSYCLSRRNVGLWMGSGSPRSPSVSLSRRSERVEPGR